MKLATCSTKTDTFLGAVVDDQIVVDLGGADRRLARKEKRPAHSFLSNMLELLSAGQKGRSAARKVLNATLAEAGKSPDAKVTFLLSRIRLRAPLVPRKLLCLSGNYQDHIEEGGGKMAVQDKETPRFFMKPATTTVIGPGERILIPPVATAIDWEGELAVVIGRKAKQVSASEALRYVAGYTVMNDVSERKLKIKNRSEDRDEDVWFDWLNGKWLDTFAPLGPWIVTSDEIPDPQVLEISTYVNGDRKQHNSTAQMLVPVANLIEYISAIVTLEPGDIISTGTVSGVGNTTGEYLKPGDKVEVKISQVGTLHSRVAASKK